MNRGESALKGRKSSSSQVAENAAAAESLHRYMKSRSEARNKQAEEQHKQKEEAARAAQERRAQALRALEEFTRKQNVAHRPSSTPTSTAQKQKSTRRKTTIGGLEIKSAGAKGEKETPKEKVTQSKLPSLQIINMRCGKENGQPPSEQRATNVGSSHVRKVGTVLSNFNPTPSTEAATKPHQHLPTPRPSVSVRSPRQSKSVSVHS